MNQSEVAQLRQRLAAECAAGWSALYGLAEGVAKHEIIMAKFRNMEPTHQRLCELIGEEQATMVLCEVYNTVATQLETRPDEQAACPPVPYGIS